ncbi:MULTISPECIES: helix-turn-helix domain-containing protein [unclassified Bradyrhizobium]
MARIARQLRDAAGLLRFRELCARTADRSVSPGQLARIETGRGTPSPRTLTSICLVFGSATLTPSYFDSVPDAWRHRRTEESSGR